MKKKEPEKQENDYPVIPLIIDPRLGKEKIVKLAEEMKKYHHDRTRVIQ